MASWNYSLNYRLLVIQSLYTSGKHEFMIISLSDYIIVIVFYYSKTHWNIMYVFGQCTDNSSSYQLSIIDSTDKKSIKQTLETVLLIDGNAIWSSLIVILC